MKKHIIPGGSALVAVVALVIALSSRFEVASARSEYRKIVAFESERTPPVAIMPPVVIADRDEKLLALTVRIEALEKEVWSESKIQLLADIEPECSRPRAEPKGIAMTFARCKAKCER
jgi:hypothetical protein